MENMNTAEGIPQQEATALGGESPDQGNCQSGAHGTSKAPRHQAVRVHTSHFGHSPLSLPLSQVNLTSLHRKIE